MGEESVEKVLKNFGLTDTEALVYVFLARHGVLKSSEIARQLKKDRAQALRILRSLQAKGLVEATLEVPTRYVSVPFEQIIDQSIKAKKDEAALLEDTKNKLLSYWKQVGKANLEPSPERFLIIEGDRRIYSKISQMVRETKNHLSFVSTVPDLLLGIRFGLLEAVIDHPLKTKIQFSFLTDLSTQNLEIMKSLLKRTLKTGIKIKSRNPDLGLSLFPRMVIRDNEEVLFFIKPKTATEDARDLCLWTNCADLIQAFTVVFEDLWLNSTDIQTKIAGIGIDKPTPETCIIKDAEIAQRKYINVVRSAKREIVLLTSSESLASLRKNLPLLKEQAERGVSTKIMAPITRENLQTARQLSKFCVVKHVSTGYLGTTIVDESHLFQFKECPPEQVKAKSSAYFECTFYTNDLDYIRKTKNVLSDLWQKAYIPSAVTLETILGEVRPPLVPLSPGQGNYARKVGVPNIIKEAALGTITEKDILDKIMNAKNGPTEKSSKVIDRMYASVGLAVIHPPDNFKLPDTMILPHKIEKQSRLGEEDAIVVLLRLDTEKGHKYVPVALAGDNPRAQAFWKTLFKGTPAEQNVQLVKKDEIEVRIHGNTLFAGWTVPVPLYPQQYVLPPACLLIEGYGDVKTTAFAVRLPMGYKSVREQNYFDAFVTFFHPSSKYSGPGTDGYFIRDSVQTMYAS